MSRPRPEGVENAGFRCSLAGSFERLALPHLGAPDPLSLAPDPAQGRLAAGGSQHKAPHRARCRRSLLVRNRTNVCCFCDSHALFSRALLAE
jgi:hypothetical protein